MFDASGNSKEFQFNVYYGENNVYFNLDSLHGQTYELIFINENKLDIKNSKSENTFRFDKIDTLNTKNRKWLTIINYDNLNFIINNEEINLSETVLNSCAENEKSESNQITVRVLKDLFL